MPTESCSAPIRPTSSIRFGIRLLALVTSLACWSTSKATSEADSPLKRILLDKPPTGIVVSRDARTLFIGLDRRFGIDGGIAAYRRTGDSAEKISEVAVPDGVLGLAVTSDERTVVASTPVGLIAVDANALLRGNPAVTTVRDGDAPGTNQLVISRDDRYVFYTNSRVANLGVARLRSPGSPTLAPSLTIVGHVPLDRVPGGLVLSHDGSEVFVASEIDNVDATTLPGSGDVRLSRTRCEVNLGPSGVLSIVSVEAAIQAPALAVLARTAAGCAPTRVALSPGGDVAWVSNRGEARVLAFDVARLHAKTGALLGSAAVGNYPIGLAVSSDDRAVLVANAGRVAGADDRAAGTLSLVDVRTVLRGAGAAASTAFPAGALPREVVAAQNGEYYVTNYDDRNVDIVTPRLPASSLEPVASGRASSSPP